MSTLLQSFFPEDNNLGAVVAVAGVPEVDTGAIAMAAADVETNNIAIDQLVGIANSLDNLADFAQASKADGGLDRNAAAVLCIAADNALEPLGVTSTIPAAENFGGVSDRMTGTGFAVEDLKTKAKAVYKAIRDAIVNAMAAIRKWFAELFDKVPGLIKKFKAIKEKAENTKGTIENKKFTLAAGPVGALAIGKKVDTAKLQDGLKEYTGYAEMLNSTGVKVIIDATEAISNGISSIKVDDAASVRNAVIDAAKGAEAGSLKGVSENIESGDKRLTGATPEGMLEVKRSGELLGNNAFFTILPTVKFAETDVTIAKDGDKEVVTVSDEKLKVLQALAKGSMKFQAYSHKKVDHSEQDVETLSSSNVADHAQIMIDLLENLTKNVDNAAKIEKAKEGGLKSLTAFEKEITDSDDIPSSTRVVLKAIHAIGKNSLVAADDVVNKSVGAIISLANGLAPVLTGSLAEHKE